MSSNSSSATVPAGVSDSRFYNLKKKSVAAIIVVDATIVVDESRLKVMTANLLQSVKQLNSDDVTDDDVTFWNCKSWLSAKSRLHKQHNKPMLRQIYSELLERPYHSRGDWDLSWQQTLLLWWLFLEPSNKYRYSPPQLSDLPIPEWVHVRGHQSTQINYFLLRLLALDKTSRKMQSLTLVYCDEDDDDYDDFSDELGPALTAALQNQPHLTKLKLDGITEAILDALDSCTAPIQELVLNFYDGGSFSTSSLRKALRSLSATLTTLKIRYSDAKTMDFFLQEANIHCPDLIKLSLRGREFPKPHPKQSMPSVRGLTLNINNYSDHFDLSRILQIFPNVSDLKLGGDDDDGDYEDAGTMVIDSLDHLQSLSHCITNLRCIVHDRVQWWQVLQCCPNATNIELMMSNADFKEVINPDSFTELALLKNLEIRGYGVSIKAENVIRLLKSCLALESLSLPHLEIGSRSSNLSALIMLLKKKKVLRHLQTLHLGGLSNRSTTSASLLRKLMKLPKLNSVYGAPTFMLDKAEMEEVLELAKEEDMEIKVRTPGDKPDHSGWNVTRRDEGCIIA